MGSFGGWGGLVCGFSPTFLNALPRYTYSYPFTTRDSHALINSISLQVNAQRDALMAKVDKRCEAVLREFDEANDATDKRAHCGCTADTTRARLSRISCGSDVYHALERGIRCRKGVRGEGDEGWSGELSKHLDRVKDMRASHHRQARSALWPQLHQRGRHSSLSGSPVQLSMPCAAASEVIVPIYRCGQDGAFREVHSVCHVNEDTIYISFGGIPPDYVIRTAWSQ